MADVFSLTPTEVVALRALNERIIEATPTEVAVSGLISPSRANTALSTLQKLGLANSWTPITGGGSETVYVPTDLGQSIYRALAQYKSVPAVGSIIRVVSPHSRISSWFSQQHPSYVEIAAEPNSSTE